MTRVIYLGAIWAVIVPLAIAQKPDSATEVKAMAGKWKAEKAEYIGKDVLGLYDGLTIEITEDGKYTIALGKLRGSVKTVLEPTSCHSQDTEADHTGCQGCPGVADDALAVVPDPHPSEPFDPADRPLHHPSHSAQAAAVRGVPL